MEIETDNGMQSCKSFKFIDPSLSKLQSAKICFEQYKNESLWETFNKNKY